MLTSTMTGNLGNHMWNYVLCRIVAEKLGYDWGVNPVPTQTGFFVGLFLFFLLLS